MHFCELGNGGDTFTGTMIETSKANTIDALAKLGIPTTRGATTTTLQGAVQLARKLGFPCVVKPLNRSKGKGITAGITDMKELTEAFALATSPDRPLVLVENHVQGIDHRIMVVNDRVLWTYSKVPASVTGDGTSTVRALIERENAARSLAKDSGMTILEPINMNAELEGFLKRRYSVGFDDILAESRRIELASQANVALGGILEDVTTRLHPDNRRLAVRVARYLRMNALGIDFVTPDISRSWKDVPCAIIEVNRTPGVSGEGDTSLAVRTIFPREGCGQIPVLVTIGGEEFRRRVGGHLFAAAKASGARVRAVQYQGREGFPAVIDTERPRAINMALLDPEVDAIVLGCDPHWIAERGFPLGRADLAFAEDPAALSYLDGVIAEISALPSESGAVERKVAAVFAHHAREGALIPVLTLATTDEGLQIRCLRFAATPRDWFYGELGLPDRGTHHMIEYSDVSSAITQLANQALAEAGAPGLEGEARLEQPASPWATPFVDCTLPVSADAVGPAAEAVGKAIDAINEVLSRRLD